MEIGIAEVKHRLPQGLPSVGVYSTSVGHTVCGHTDHKPRAEVTGSMSRRVLIADDFEDTRRLTKLILEKYGYEVEEARDGFEAVKKAVEHHPDIILMDIAMPVMDGIQATQAIRQHPELSDIPILAITAYGDFYSERARDAGCNDVVQKPLEITQLTPIVHKYIH
jgi:CheY-like chemotaxis protein